MIRINNMNSGDAHVFFELLRIYFPYYEEEELLVLHCFESLEESRILIEFPRHSNELIVSNKLEVREYRRHIAKWIIHDIADIHKVNSPWGILTGIRPIKFSQKLRKEYSDSEVYKKLIDEYYVSDEMAKLIMEISIIEEKATMDVDEYGYSLYVNIPFCPSRCHYCSFPTMKNTDRSVIKTYMNALKRELDSVLDNANGLPTSIYVGGGTPTSIPVEELDQLLSILDLKAVGQEFTLEAGRPDTLSREMLEMLSSHKINRISINPQTMVDKTLVSMGRKHTSKDIKDVYYLARSISNWSINMDLILGLPGEELGELRHTLMDVLALGPENITVHTLSLKNGSKVFEKNMTSFRCIDDLENESLKVLKQNEYRPYYMYRQKRILGNGMNIGYSKKDKESIYNMIMMEELQSVIGIGMSSTSKIFEPRKDCLNKFSNYRNMRDYLEKIDTIIEKKINLLKEL